MKLYVAVVMGQDLTNKSSRHPWREWASFVAKDAASAIAQALEAVAAWNNNPGPNAPYRVLVGELTSEAKSTSNYHLVAVEN